MFNILGNSWLHYAAQYLKQTNQKDRNGFIWSATYLLYPWLYIDVSIIYCTG